MIIKFCYNDEIHRSSDPPKDFASLHSFLTFMFRTPIPPQIDLFYTNPEGQTIFLSTEQDYQELMRAQSSKPVKVVIIERKHAQDEKDPLNGEFEREEAAEYEVIPNYEDDQREEIIEEKAQDNIIEIPDREEHDKKEPDHAEEEQILLSPQEEKQEEFADVYDKISEKISEKYVMPQVHSNPGMEPAQVKSLVKEALREEMPFIIAQVRESLMREGQLPVQSKPAEIPQPQHNPQHDPQQRNNRPPVSYAPYYSYPYYYQQPINRLNTYPGQIQQVPPQIPVQAVQGPSHVIPQGFHQVPPMVPPMMPPQRLVQRVVSEPQVQMNNGFMGAGQQMNQVNNGNRERQPRFFDKVVNTLGGHINKASEMVDNFVQKFEGDPYVYCAEGKYNQSVVEKVAQLKEIFPDEDKKELLEFAQRFPRDAPLDQLAEVYWSKKKMT